jgi:hypothetical protein
MTDPEPTGLALAARQWWVVLLIPFGFTAWIAFLFVGLRVQRWVWVGWGALYLAFVVVLLTAYGEYDSLDPNPAFESITLIAILTVWMVSASHGRYIRREYLERRRLSEIGTDVLTRRQVASEMARSKPRLARAIGIGRPDCFGARHSGLIDPQQRSRERAHPVAGDRRAAGGADRRPAPVHLGRGARRDVRSARADHRGPARSGGVHLPR